MKLTPAKEIGKTEVLRDKYASVSIVLFESFYDLRKKWIRVEMTWFEFVIWLSEEDSVGMGRLQPKSSN